MSELRKPILAVDCDGPLAAIPRGAITVALRKSFRKFFPKLHRKTEDFLLARASVRKGAREALGKLKKKFGIVVVTRRPEELRRTTANWLEGNKILFDELLMMPLGSELGGNKIPLVKKAKAIALVDDEESELGKLPRGITGIKFVNWGKTVAELEGIYEKRVLR